MSLLCPEVQAAGTQRGLKGKMPVFLPPLFLQLSVYRGPRQALGYGRCKRASCIAHTLLALLRSRGSNAGCIGSLISGGSLPPEARPRPVLSITSALTPSRRTDTPRRRSDQLQGCRPSAPIIGRAALGTCVAASPGGGDRSHGSGQS